MQQEQNTSRTEISEKKLKSKIKKYARSAGKEMIEKSLMMYYSAKDPATPKWARTLVFATLAYFIMPFDAIPDFIPITGLSDDLISIISAFSLVAVNISEEHKAMARKKLSKFFKEIES